MMISTNKLSELVSAMKYLEFLNTPETFAIGAAVTIVAAIVLRSAKKQDDVDLSLKMAKDLLSENKVLADSVALSYLRKLGWSVAPLGMPPGTLAFVACEVAKSNAQKLPISKTKMPLSWHERVIRNSSEEGRQFIEKRIQKNGHITVGQAVIWAEIESKPMIREAADTAELRALINQLTSARKS